MFLVYLLPAVIIHEVEMLPLVKLLLGILENTSRDGHRIILEESSDFIVRSFILADGVVDTGITCFDGKADVVARAGDPLCVVCRFSVAQCYCTPCGHLSLCFDCATKTFLPTKMELLRCPVCRKQACFVGRVHYPAIQEA